MIETFTPEYIGDLRDIARRVLTESQDWIRDLQELPVDAVDALYKANPKQIDDAFADLKAEIRFDSSDHEAAEC